MAPCGCSHGSLLLQETRDVGASCQCQSGTHLGTGVAPGGVLQARHWWAALMRFVCTEMLPTVQLASFGAAAGDSSVNAESHLVMSAERPVCHEGHFTVTARAAVCFTSAPGASTFHHTTQHSRERRCIHWRWHCLAIGRPIPGVVQTRGTKWVGEWGVPQQDSCGAPCVFQQAWKNRAGRLNELLTHLHSNMHSNMHSLGARLPHQPRHQT